MLTADEFFALPGELTHTQLIDGEIVVDTPNTRHQRIAGWLFFRLTQFAHEHPGSGEAGYELTARVGDHDVFVPDVWWTTPDHRPGRDSVGHEGLPDLAVEVRSPSTWRYDTGAKKDRYEAAGLRELWLVDTESDTIEVHRRSSGDSARFDVTFTVGAGAHLDTPLIGGFVLDVGELFAR